MTHDRIPDHQQAGWNAGYIAGEADRLALVTTNCDLRHDLDEALQLIADLLARDNGKAVK